MKLTIVIVSYNTADLLIRCLSSIVSVCQLDKDAFEVIIIDNDSSDETVSKVEDFQSRHQDYRIVLKRNTDNLGFSKAVNQGLKIAGGRHVLLLNSDTRISPGSLSQLVEFADKKKDVGVVAPQLINPDQTVQPSCFHFPTILRAIREFWFNEENAFSKYVPKGGQSSEVDAVVGAVALITQKALAKVGKLDEKYFMYFEDIDYCKRVWQAGLKVYYLPTIKIEHEHGASGKEMGDKTRKWLVQSSKKYHGLVKHYLINWVIWVGQKCQKK